MKVKLKDGTVGEIRLKDPTDGEAIGRMLESCSEKTYHFFHPYPLTMASGHKVAEDKGILCELLIVGDEVAGYAWLQGFDLPLPTLGICIGDRWQGKGAGRLLMDACVVDARDRVCSGIRLTVNKDNVRARALYRSMGFEIVGDAGGRFPSYEMRMVLD